LGSPCSRSPGVLLFVVLGVVLRQRRTAHRRVQAGDIRDRAAEQSRAVSEREALAEETAARASTQPHRATTNFCAYRLIGVTMSAVTERELSRPFVLPDSGVLSQPWEGHTARLEVRRLKSSVAVISAHGEIDASNAGTLAQYTLGHVTGCRALILDLRGLDFFGVNGFSALHEVSAGCARAGIGWAVVPGAAVSLVLRICDPQGTLPAASTLAAALAGQRHTALIPV
jgi:anti-anti-sigma factor